MRKINVKRIARIMILSFLIMLFSVSGVVSFQPTGTKDAIITNVQAATMGQRNALTTAKDYLRTQAFSKKGLIRQLKFEGYSTKEANYGVKHCKANWKKQAAKMAKEYLDTMSFSKSGLKRQLRFEGFTNKEVNYAIKKAYR